MKYVNRVLGVAASVALAATAAGLFKSVSCEKRRRKKLKDIPKVVVEDLNNA